MKTITICLSDASLELLTLLTDEEWGLDLRAVVEQFVADGLEAHFVPKDDAVRVDLRTVAEAPRCSGRVKVVSLAEARLRRRSANARRNASSLRATAAPLEVA
jgi:hypothetical protein